MRTNHGSSSLVQQLLYTALVMASSALPANAQNRVQQVIVVFKTHLDIGYTDLATNVLNRYRTEFADKALKVIEHSRTLPPEQQFVWTIAGWPLKEMLWPGQTPERREKILRAVKEGRLAFHALPFSLQTESLDLEELVRGLEFSADLARENGLPLPRAAKMTDVPEHTWVLPTLLKHAGVDFLHIGCNSGSAPMHVPELFWWQGPDGSRLLTFYSAQYGTGLVPPQDWPYRTWLAMIMTGDNHGPPTEAEVDKLLQQARQELPGVRIKFGRMEDFSDAILQEKAAQIPVARGDMPDTWIHGFASMPIETKLAWNLRPLAGTAALLDTELRAAGVNPPPLAQPLAKAYENSLLYSEHTFGYFGRQPGGFWYGDEWKRKLAEGKYKRFLQSFEDKRDYIRATAKIVTNALGERLQFLAQNVAAEGPRIVVFNPLPWERDGEVEVSLSSGDWSGVRDLSNGHVAKFAAARGQTLSFLAEDLPPGGYKTYQPVVRAADAAKPANRGATIENEFFRLKADPARGGLISLVDLKTGRDLVEAADEHSFGSYWHERYAKTNVQAFVKSYCRNWALTGSDFDKPNMPGPEQSPYAAFELTNWTVSVESSALAQTLILHSGDAASLARAVTLKYTLYAAQPYLDVEWLVEDKTPDPIPEGGWLCLPFAIGQPQFKLARLGSLIDPVNDIIDGGNRHLLCLNSGLTITGPEGYGVGLCPLDSPLVSLDEPGLWKFSLQYTPRRARVFLNLYNNEWNTNFPLWQQGSWNSRVRIWVVRRGNPERNLITPAWEAREPLLAAFAEGAGGKLPVKNTGLKLSRRGVLVTHLGPDPYSEKTLLRVWELAGNSGALTVTLPAGIQARRAIPVGLRGELAGDALRIVKGRFAFPLGAFAPASFRLE